MNVAVGISASVGALVFAVPAFYASRQFLHFGAAYKIRPRQQLDFYVAARLWDAASRGYIVFGYSFLIGPGR